MIKDSSGRVTASKETGPIYYMRVEDPGNPDSTIWFTDTPDRYESWSIFIRRGKSRSGSRYRDFLKNFHIYDKHIRSIGAEHGVSPALIKAIVMAESAFNPRAKSHAGALGLMQLLPATARVVGCEDPFDPVDNLGGGTRYLKQMLLRFGGNTRLAVAAYNAGPEAVNKYKGVPPYSETQAYVRKVLALYSEFHDNNLALAKR